MIVSKCLFTVGLHLIDLRLKSHLFCNNPQVPLYHAIDLLENIGPLSCRIAHILALADILWYVQLVFPANYELDLEA